MNQLDRRRHRRSAERRHRDRRRPPAEADAGPRGARVLHPRLVGAARALVQDAAWRRPHRRTATPSPRRHAEKKPPKRAFSVDAAVSVPRLASLSTALLGDFAFFASGAPSPPSSRISAAASVIAPRADGASSFSRMRAVLAGEAAQVVELRAAHVAPCASPRWKRCTVRRVWNVRSTPSPLEILRTMN